MPPSPLQAGLVCQYHFDDRIVPPHQSFKATATFLPHHSERDENLDLEACGLLAACSIVMSASRTIRVGGPDHMPNCLVGVEGNVTAAFMSEHSSPFGEPSGAYVSTPLR